MLVNLLKKQKKGIFNKFGHEIQKKPHCCVKNLDRKYCMFISRVMFSSQFTPAVLSCLLTSFAFSDLNTLFFTLCVFLENSRWIRDFSLEIPVTSAQSGKTVSNEQALLSLI